MNTSASRRGLPALLFVLAHVGLAGCGQDPSPTLLPHRTLLESHDWWDSRDWGWYEANIPFFDSPDPELNATWYYRWEVLTKHLVYGSPETGYTFTEFIDRPFWSGSYGAISCPLGHVAYEIRWLKDRRVIEDFARYWFETPGAEPRSYSNWYGDAMWATYAVLGDTALLRTVYPHMQMQVEGWTEERWDPEHRMYRWVGAWDGMETNINSRLTDDEFGGGEGYRPTLNSYLYADMRAIARAAALFGEAEKADSFAARAAALKERVQEELWDPERGFFFHQFAFDEKGGIEAGSLTYETGPYAGDPHGRELIGYVPWQFGLPDPGYESAWRFLMDPAYFRAEYGPTGVEQGDPQFRVSPRCCVWSGNAWPYATSQTLTAMANLLHDYDQAVVDAGDYVRLLRTYALSHRMEGRPYIAEAADPYTGSWAGHNTFYHSEHYLHSGFLDQVITGLVGLRPRSDDTLRVNPLVPGDWDHFALEGVDYHGYELTILWDRHGDRYGRGAGLALFLDGREVARVPELREIRTPIPPPVIPDPEPRLNNYAVNNDAAFFPRASASSSHPLHPPFYVVDGNRWYHPSPPNRWVAVPGGSGRAEDRRDTPVGRVNGDGGEEWFEIDFGTERTLSRVQLYFLDDVDGPAVDVTGEEEGSGFPGLDPAVAAPAPWAEPPSLPVRPPESFDLQYRDGEGWRDVPGQERTPAEPAGRRANTVDFPELGTSRIRAVFRPSPGATMGLTEFEAWGEGALPPVPATAPVPNLAWQGEGGGFPTISASYTYRADAGGEAADERIALTRYSRNRWTAYRSPNGKDWLEVAFAEPRTVARLELYLYGDGRGIAAPADYRVEVWIDGQWTRVPVLDRDPRRPLAWALNTVELEPVRTGRLRVVFRHALPSATGVTELRVWGPEG